MDFDGNALRCARRLDCGAVRRPCEGTVVLFGRQVGECTLEQSPQFVGPSATTLCPARRSLKTQSTFAVTIGRKLAPFLARAISEQQQARDRSLRDLLQRRCRNHGRRTCARSRWGSQPLACRIHRPAAACRAAARTHRVPPPQRGTLPVARRALPATLVPLSEKLVGRRTDLIARDSVRRLQSFPTAD